MTRTGHIKLHRQIMDSEFYKEPRKFSKYEAWIDLLLRANHKEEDGIQAGSFLTSYSELAKSWGWSKSTTWNFLKYLSQQDMIIFDLNENGTGRRTVVTIVKWDLYQSKKNAKRNESGTKNESLPITEKEDKNILSLAEFVSMTKKEADKLVDEFGLEATKAMVEILNNYKGSSGKKYKSDYLAIRSWVIKRYQEDKKKGLLFNDGNLYDPPH